LSRPRGNRGLEVFVPDERERPPEQLAEGDADGRPGNAAELVELREELTKERVARARLEERLAASERREGDLAAALALERSRSDRLEAVLVEARRPWLARVLEGLRRKGS
jgi:hypothetical protein